MKQICKQAEPQSVLNPLNTNTGQTNRTDRAAGVTGRRREGGRDRMQSR